MYVAAAGIGLPFILGVGVSILVFKSMNLDEHSSFGPFVLFMGVSLSITAFPVLARILAERKILNTQVPFEPSCPPLFCLRLSRIALRFRSYLYILKILMYQKGVTE